MSKIGTYRQTYIQTDRVTYTIRWSRIKINSNRKKKAVDHFFGGDSGFFSDGPYIVWGVSIYQNVCG